MFLIQLRQENTREGIEVFRKCNPNPKKKRVGDCTIRALAIATDQDWERVFAGLAVKAFEDYDMPSANNVWEEYVRSKGYVKKLLPDTCPRCYTVEDFAADHQRGTYILAIGDHVVCVKDGDWCDTWDSGDEVPVYYWEKRKENE